MGKNAFLNDLLFELQQMTTTKIIKGGGPKEDKLSDAIPLTVTPVSISPSVPASTSSNLTSQLTGDIPNIISMVNNLSKTLLKYLQDPSKMTQKELKDNGFSQEQIAAIQKLKEKYKPIEKEILEGDIILGEEGEEGAIVLNRQTQNYLGKSKKLATQKDTDNINNTDIDIR